MDRCGQKQGKRLSSSIGLDSDINRSGQFCEEFLVVGCGLLSISLQTLSWRRRCAPSCENSYVDFELIFALAHNWQMALYIKGLQKKCNILWIPVFIPADTLIRKDRFVQVMDGGRGIPLCKNHPPAIEQKQEGFLCMISALKAKI